MALTASEEREKCSRTSLQELRTKALEEAGLIHQNLGLKKGMLDESKTEWQRNGGQWNDLDQGFLHSFAPMERTRPACPFGRPAQKTEGQ